MRRDTFLKSLAALAAAGTLPLAARAAAANLKMMIPANPGGGWDTTGRELGKAMLASGAVKNMQYDNKGGAAGAIGDWRSRGLAIGRQSFLGPSELLVDRGAFAARRRQLFPGQGELCSQRLLWFAIAHSGSVTDIALPPLTDRSERRIDTRLRRSARRVAALLCSTRCGDWREACCLD